jgi:hypothetical protein
MLVRYPGARHSRDVDLVYSGDDVPDMDEAIAALRRAATIDLDDYLRFDFLDCKQPAPGASGRKVRFNAYIGTIQVTCSAWISSSTTNRWGGRSPANWSR